MITIENNLPVFSNRENERVSLPDREIWMSRSAAVVGEVVLKVKNERNFTYDYFILMVKRGPKTPDFQGFWCLPCGYLDWDELLQEALLREVYEECGLFIPNMQYEKGFISASEFMHLPFIEEHQPWKVTSTPSGKQNISMHFKVIVNWEPNTPFPYLTAENAEEGEVAQLMWMPLAEALSRDLAFNHSMIVKELAFTL